MDICFISIVGLWQVKCVWTFTYRSLCRLTLSFSSWENTSGSIAWSTRECMFNFLRSHQAVFQSGCHIWHPRWQCVRVPVASHPCQHLVWSVLLIIVISGGVKRCLTVVLRCISLRTDVVFRVFICHLYNFLSEVCMPFASLLRVFFFFLTCFMEFGEFLIFSGYKLRYMLCKYFLFVGCIFILLTVSFEKKF